MMQSKWRKETQDDNYWYNTQKLKNQNRIEQKKDDQETAAAGMQLPACPPYLFKADIEVTEVLLYEMEESLAQLFRDSTYRCNNIANKNNYLLNSVNIDFEESDLSSYDTSIEHEKQIINRLSNKDMNMKFIIDSEFETGDPIQRQAMVYILSSGVQW